MSGSDRVTSAGSGVKLTYDDFLLFPEDGQRHELIDGEHYVTPTPKLSHQAIVGRLYLPIANYLAVTPIGRVFLSPLDVILSNFDVVEPDLLYVSNERAEILRDWVHGAPDLAVEVGSPSTRQRDETIKRALYERFGVVEYWVIDPEIDVVRIYRRTADDRFERPVELSLEAGDVLTTPLLPGLELPLARIFRD